MRDRGVAMGCAGLVVLLILGWVAMVCAIIVGSWP